MVISEATAKTTAARKADGKSLWRVSSTLFGHCASDRVLQPLGHFATDDPASAAAYPPVDVGQQVQDELNAIALGAGFGKAKQGSGGKKRAADGEVSAE